MEWNGWRLARVVRRRERVGELAMEWPRIWFSTCHQFLNTVPTEHAHLSANFVVFNFNLIYIYIYFFGGYWWSCHVGDWHINNSLIHWLIYSDNLFHILRFLFLSFLFFLTIHVFPFTVFLFILCPKFFNTIPVLMYISKF